MIVFGGSNSARLAEKVARASGAELGCIDSRRFPDGECYVRIKSEVKDLDCVVVQTADSNDSLVGLLLTLDALRDHGASSVHAVIPYMAYSRQDKRFHSGEALSAKTVLRMIDCFSDSITTINAHFLDTAGVFDFHEVKVKNLDAFPLLANYFKSEIGDHVIVAPDKGALQYAREAAAVIGCGFDFLQKRRLGDHEVEISTNGLDVSGKDVVIIDDMISTGGTIAEASKCILSHGASSVSAGCVHGVFSKGLSMFSSLREVICTDTIETEASKVSVADLIAKSLR